MLSHTQRPDGPRRAPRSPAAHRPGALWHPSGPHRAGGPTEPLTPWVSPLPGLAPLVLPADGTDPWGVTGSSGASLGKGDAGEGQLGGTRVACAPISSTNPPLWGEALAAWTGPNLINSVVRNTGTCQGASKHRLQFPDNASHPLSSCSDPGGG